MRLRGLVRSAYLNGLVGLCKSSATSVTDRVAVLLDHYRGREVSVSAANVVSLSVSTSVCPSSTLHANSKKLQ